MLKVVRRIEHNFASGKNDYSGLYSIARGNSNRLPNIAVRARYGFNDKGIVIEGTIRRDRVRQFDGSLPPGLAIVATYTTSIADILNRAGKNSQNVRYRAFQHDVGGKRSRQLVRRTGRRAEFQRQLRGCDASSEKDERRTGRRHRQSSLLDNRDCKQV